ncbi:uncharacterized protein LOC111618723 [Centruroides sculpturatus]|uniref:uncharacterized protein LOC111618723 n=1 Tax=Centruroides sculpturatus TaxID=218467 RepID=UPI000C6EF767|nr:uncharacterized protein LOC111618723 [Centruroides sculpturatus]
MDSILGGYIGCTETTINNETSIIENDNYVDTESTQLSPVNFSQLNQNDVEIVPNIDINQEIESDQLYQAVTRVLLVEEKKKEKRIQIQIIRITTIKLYYLCHQCQVQ